MCELINVRTVLKLTLNLLRTYRQFSSDSAADGGKKESDLTKI